MKLTKWRIELDESSWKDFIVYVLEGGRACYRLGTGETSQEIFKRDYEGVSGYQRERLRHAFERVKTERSDEQTQSLLQEIEESFDLIDVETPREI